MAHAHQRSFSNSYRVNITSVSPVKPSAKSTGARPFYSAARNAPARSAATAGTPPLLKSLLYARTGKVRLGRIASTLALVGLCLAAWRRTAAPPSSLVFPADDLMSPPPVVKGVLDQLRRLENLIGGPDLGEDDIRGWTMDQASPDADAASALDDAEVVPFGDAANDMPAVVTIPEPLRYPKMPMPPPPPTMRPVAAAQIDAVACPAQAALGLPCGFVVPAFVGEQETKAQQHLHQLGLLALHLNRTLVLPNVSKSRMGTCYSYAFDLYYDPDSLARLGVPTIPYETFIQWSKRREPHPTGQLISVMPGKSSYPAGAIEVDPLADAGLLPHKPDRSLCLDKGKTKLDFARYSPITIWGPEKWHQSDSGRVGFGESIVRTLQGREALESSWRPPTDLELAPEDQEMPFPDVLVFNHEIRFPILHAEDVPTTISLNGQSLLPFEHFPYASTWIRLANFLSSQLRPYAAVHWRQETLNPSRLTPCASQLLETLAKLKSDHPDLKSFYLATDYPLEDLEGGREGTVAHSGTFAKLLTADHHSTMRKFLKDLGGQVDAGSNLALSTFAREQERLVRRLPADLAAELAAALPRPAPSSGVPITPGSRARSEYTSAMMLAALKDLDPGLWGIIDKIVSMEADVFVSGRPGVCAKESSFTRQIVEARTSIALDQTNVRPNDGAAVHLRNVVEYWGKT